MLTKPDRIGHKRRRAQGTGQRAQSTKKSGYKNLRKSAENSAKICERKKKKDK